VQNTLGPVGGWFIRDSVIGKVKITEGATVVRARSDDGRVHLELRRADGTESELTCDHVIAATGYRVDLERLGLLDPELSAQIATVARTPVLSNYFESSVPNLYFVGATAANSFGPVLRFAYGARFVARRLTRHLVRARNP
jgi:thioredoxin reductase